MQCRECGCLFPAKIGWRYAKGFQAVQLNQFTGDYDSFPRKGKNLAIDRPIVSADQDQQTILYH